MISGGDFPINLRKFEPFQATVALDLDKSPRGPLPNAANQPIPEGKMMANDEGYIRFGDIPSVDPKFGKVRALRVQANSEVPGLFGKEGGGWSQYSVVIEETGYAYAQVVKDGAKGVYGEIYRLDNPEFGGAASRALEIAVEIAAGYELGLAYQSQIDPLHQLARKTVKGETPSTDLLEQAVRSFAVGPRRALVDIDHDNKKYDPSVNIVQVHEDTNFAKFDAVEGSNLPRVKDVACIRFQSEVDVPEYGQKPPPEQKLQDPDPVAPRYLCFTESGLEVFDAEENIRLVASSSSDRLRLNAAVGLTALGNLSLSFPLTQTLKQAIPNLKTDAGRELPKADRIEEDRWDDYNLLGL